MNNDQLKKVAIEALETCAIGSGVANGFTKTYWFDEQKVKAAIAALTAAQSAQSTSKIYTYASTQATTCAGCGKHKHTPLRIDAMGGYVCLTCIDQKLGSLLDEFGYPESAGKDEREVFEEWYGSTGGRRSPEEMIIEVFCWDAWQAGRASLAKEQEQKPRGWFVIEYADNGEECLTHTHKGDRGAFPLYVAPQAQHSDAWHRLVISLGCMFGFETSGSIDEVAASARDACDKQAQQEAGKGAEGGRGIDGPDYLRLSKSGYTLRVGWGDEKRIVAASPRQLHEMSAEAQRQWLEDADRLCDGWNRIENTKTGD